MFALARPFNLEWSVLATWRLSFSSLGWILTYSRYIPGSLGCLGVFFNLGMPEISEKFPWLEAKSEEKGKEKLLYFRKADTAMPWCVATCCPATSSHIQPHPATLQADCEWNLRTEIGKKVTYAATWLKLTGKWHQNASSSQTKTDQVSWRAWNRIRRYQISFIIKPYYINQFHNRTWHRWLGTAWKGMHFWGWGVPGWQGRRCQGCGTWRAGAGWSTGIHRLHGQVPNLI